jgi:hypothetical protein
VPVEPPAGPFRSRAELGLPDAFTFLFLFDFVSAERKNPWGVVEAFTRAFSPDEGPVLLLKSINGRERKSQRLKELLAFTKRRKDVIVRDGYVSPEERDSYLAACDCYVSLHRSEGFGLTLAEAMACGKPVIATGYSGNLEFMNEENSYFVPYELVQIPDDWWAYGEDAQWAEPDVDAAARLMSRVYENQSRSHERAERARAALVDAHSMTRAATFVAARCRHARERLVEPAPTVVFREHVRKAAYLAARMGRGAEGSVGRTPRALLRRLIFRALWPYFDERRRFDSEAVDALVRMQRQRHHSGAEPP